MRASNVVGSAVTLVLLCGGLAVAEETKGNDARRKAPPPEAVAACTGRKDGAACTFTLKDTRVTGVCHPGPEGGMACRPNRGNRPPPQPAQPPAPAPAPRG